MSGEGQRVWLAAVVAVHLVVSLVHGAAHEGAHVPLSAAANAYVFLVILAGPLAGLALSRATPRVGNWLILLTMAGSLVFGVLNHFLLASPDHVAHVDPRWTPLFAATAMLLAVTEALGCALGALVLGRSRVARPIRGSGL